MPSIDLTAVLRRTVSVGYDDLVTRRTGQAVRHGVLQDLETIDHGEVAIIDFSGVRCLDFSCADEIVGKLLLEHGHIRYFLLRGVTESHEDAICQILERYEIAVVAQTRSGRILVLGSVSEPVRRAFDCVTASGDVATDDLADQMDLPVDTAEHCINELVARRLVYRHQDNDRVVSFL